MLLCGCSSPLHSSAPWAPGWVGLFFGGLLPLILVLFSGGPGWGCRPCLMIRSFGKVPLPLIFSLLVPFDMFVFPFHPIHFLVPPFCFDNSLKVFVPPPLPFPPPPLGFPQTSLFSPLGCSGCFSTSCGKAAWAGHRGAYYLVVHLSAPATRKIDSPCHHLGEQREQFGSPNNGIQRTKTVKVPGSKGFEFFGV